MCACLGWAKCWVILSLSLVAEVAWTKRYSSKLAEAAKVLFLVWCLAPIHANGADLVFDWVVRPLHWSLATTMTMLSPALRSVSAAIMKLAQYLPDFSGMVSMVS